MKQNISRS